MGRAVPPQIIFFFRIHFPLYMDFDSPQLIKMVALDKAIPRSGDQRQAPSDADEGTLRRGETRCLKLNI